MTRPWISFASLCAMSIALVTASAPSEALAQGKNVNDTLATPDKEPESEGSGYVWAYLSGGILGGLAIFAVSRSSRRGA